MSNGPRNFCDFCICNNLHCGVQHHIAFIPALGVSQYYMPVCTYVCLSIFISGHLHHCLEIIHMARNCAQLMQPRAMESNTLGGSILSLSVRLLSHPRAFCDFCICINFQCGGPVAWWIIPTLCFFVPQWSLVELICLSISLSLCPVVRVNVCRSFLRPVIATSACGRRPRDQIPWVAV